MKRVFTLSTSFACAVLLVFFGTGCSGPVLGSRWEATRTDLPGLQKAKTLFAYASRENPGLNWDPCLAKQATIRAEHLVRMNYFGHRDPRTGKNMAWDLIASCYSCRYGGENLAKGGSSPEQIHLTLMKSRSHRMNILSNKFHLLGVGCFQDVCVQLFAGL
jgi:hypothetical protein